MRRGTYSIVARDPETGELGVAVQSHWFSVGSVVPWARPGVGAVATQSFAEPGYGPKLLDRLAAGEAPPAALEALVAADSRAPVRQVAVVDASGAVAVHTGGGCVPFAGQAQADGFSVQANMMASAGVWPAMAEAFQAAEGPLARRLFATLEVGEAAGGDVRGRQSAALVVVPAKGEPWRRTVDLRIEDHPEPLSELDRLLDVHEAYALADEAEELGRQGRYDVAMERGQRALQLAPDNPELLFWAGLAVADRGELELGRALVSRAIDLHAGWRDLLARLDPEIAPGVERVREALGVDPFS